MKLSKTLKVIVGLATGSYLLLPILFVVVWFAALFAAMAGSNFQGEPPPFFFAVIFGMFPLICLVNILHFGLQIFYIIHIIKNTTANETYRILTGIGLLFLPWLAAPVYFFIYIWPDDPPDWALDEQRSSETAPPPVPATYPADEGLDPAFAESPEPEQSEDKPESDGTVSLDPEEPIESGIPEEADQDEQDGSSEQTSEKLSGANDRTIEGFNSANATMITPTPEERSGEPKPNDPSQTSLNGELKPPDDATMIGGPPAEEPEKDG